MWFIFPEKVNYGILGFFFLLCIFLLVLLAGVELIFPTMTSIGLRHVLEKITNLISLTKQKKNSFGKMKQFFSESV